MSRGAEEQGSREEKKIDLADSICLVTGGAGNIGSYIVDALIEERARMVVVVDNFYNGHMENLEEALQARNTRVVVENEDISDYDRLLAVFLQYKPQYVWHQASMLTIDCEAHPRQAIDYNITGTFNVIECCLRVSVEKIVYASSASVFGDPRYLPVDEGHPFDNKLLYGATKIANEALFTSYAVSRGLPYVGLRYYNVYSERQRRGHLYTQVIPKWTSQIESQGYITINDDGSQSMDLIHAWDVARANILAMKQNVENEFFNIGTGIETTVRQLAEMFVEFFADKPFEIRYVPHDPNLVKRRRCSTEKSERLLGFKAEIKARDGVRRCVEHYRQQRAHVSPELELLRAAT